MYMELDQEKIKKRFAEVDEALAEVKRLVTFRDSDFWSKKENIAAVKYYLLQAIEAIGSICVHVAAKRYNKGVSVFGECFEILLKEDALDENLAARLRRMTKFRNKLIHRYWEIDDKQVLDYARNNLDDFSEFMKVIGGITQEPAPLPIDEPPQA